MGKKKLEGPRKYELMVILDPLRTEEQQKETLDKIEDTIKKYGGTPDKRDAWGKRRLAFPIKKRRDGYYAVFQFDAEPSKTNVLDEVDRFCRYQEEILRYLRTGAIVGKSLGNPTLAAEMATRMASRYDRPDRRERRPPMGGDGGDRGGPPPAPAVAPVAAPVEAPAAEAPSA